MRTFLYARVSTTDQTAAHQLTQAREAGYDIKDDDVLVDEGVSGTTTKLKDRPQGSKLCMLHEGDVLVVRWVDRLGRDYEDVSDTIRKLMRRGVVVKTLINGMVFDGATKDPMQRAVRDSLIAFMAALSQAQAEATREAQRAGIAHAKAQDAAGMKYRGRKPSYTRQQFDQARVMLDKGAGPSEISRTIGVSRQAVVRMKMDPAGSEHALERWGM